jgi:peptidoglycan hydrolase-like amidase
VLAAEGDPRAAEAAQQALADRIRTYTLKNVDRHARDGYDLCDSTHCQVLRPFDSHVAPRGNGNGRTGAHVSW